MGEEPPGLIKDADGLKALGTWCDKSACWVRHLQVPARRPALLLLLLLPQPPLLLLLRSACLLSAVHRGWTPAPMARAVPNRFATAGTSR